jgi:hypothetical protein
MRTLLTTGAIGAAALALTACATDSYGGQYASACERDQQTKEAAGTAVGAGIGALAGSGIAGRGDRTEGAVIGGIAGAVVGNQLSKSRGECDVYYDGSGRGYYYDDQGRPYYR